MTDNHLLLYRLAELMLEHEQHVLPVDLLFDEEQIGDFVKSIQIDSPYQQMLIEGVLTEAVRDEKLYVSFTVEGYFHFVLGEVIYKRTEGLGAESLKRIVEENKLNGAKEGVEQCLIREVQKDDLNRLICLIDEGGKMIEISSLPLAYAFINVRINSKSNVEIIKEYQSQVEHLLTLLLENPSDNDIDVLSNTVNIIEHAHRNDLLRILLDRINDYVIPNTKVNALLFLRSIEFLDKAKQVYRLEYLINDFQSVIRSRDSEIFFLLGQQFKNLANYNNSILYFEEALEVEKSNSNNLFLKHKIYNSLGTAWRENGDYNKAFHYYNKALKIGIDFFGTDHPLTSYSFNNIGVIWSDLGDNKKAIQNFEISLEIEKRVNGEQHPMTSIRYNNLGVLSNEIGDFKKALYFQFKGLEVNQNLFGELHNSTCRSYINIGEIYMNIASFEEAEFYYRKGMSGYELTYGQYHPTVAESQYYLGLLYLKMNQLNTALEFFHNSQSQYEIIFNKDHPYVARAKESLGDVYSGYGNLNFAKQYFNDALETYKKTLGDEHPRLKSLISKVNNINDL
jgi:tetratricopeptide (TPR) repeat protein